MNLKKTKTSSNTRVTQCETMNLTSCNKHPTGLLFVPKISLVLEVGPFQLCSSCKDVGFVEGLRGHLVVIWSITNWHEWNFRDPAVTIYFSIFQIRGEMGNLHSTVYPFVSFWSFPKIVHFSRTFFFVKLKDVHVTTRGPGSINRYTCNIYSTLRLWFQRNQSALLTIYHYKVTCFFFLKCANSQAAGKECIKC